jgi:hypothetical protein
LIFAATGHRESKNRFKSVDAKEAEERQERAKEIGSRNPAPISVRGVSDLT